MNEKVDVEIAKRRLTVEMEGLTQLEVIALARAVSDRLEEVSRANDKVADTSKLALLTALDFAAELSRLRESQETARRVLENRVMGLSEALRAGLAAAGEEP